MGSDSIWLSQQHWKYMSESLAWCAATESNCTMLVWGSWFFSGISTCSTGTGWGTLGCILHFTVVWPPTPNMIPCPCGKHSTLTLSSAAQSFIARHVTYLYLSILICWSLGNNWLHIYPTMTHTSVNSTLQNRCPQIRVESSHLLPVIKIKTTYTRIAKQLLQELLFFFLIEKKKERGCYSKVPSSCNILP